MFTVWFFVASLQDEIRSQIETTKSLLKRSFAQTRKFFEEKAKKEEAVKATEIPKGFVATGRVQETVKLSAPTPRLRGPAAQADPKKFEKEFSKQQQVALEDLKKRAKTEVRKASLASAVSETKKFEEELKQSFRLQDKKISEAIKRGEKKVIVGTSKQDGVVVTQRQDLKKFQKRIQDVKGNLRSQFQKSLEGQLTSFERDEVKRAVAAASRTAEFKREVGQRTLGKIVTGTGRIKPEFAKAEVRARLPTVAPRAKPGVRQEVGVAAGKAVAGLVTFGQAAKLPELERQRAERLGVAAVRGVTFGVLAPKFVIETPEEAIIAGVGRTAGFEFVVAPAISRVATGVARAFPRARKALEKLPGAEVTEETREVLRPVEEQRGFRVVAQEVVGARVGPEEVVAGRALAFPTGAADDVFLAPKAQIFRVTERVGGPEIIEAGTREFGERVVTFGGPRLELPSPLEIEIFKRTGRVPTALPFTEAARVTTAAREIPPEVIAKGTRAVEEFLGQRVAVPGRAVEFFAEVRAPVDSDLLKGREEIFSLISSGRRGVTPTTQFAALGPSQFDPITSKELARAFAEATAAKKITVVDIPKLRGPAIGAGIVGAVAKGKPGEVSVRAGEVSKRVVESLGITPSQLGKPAPISLGVTVRAPAAPRGQVQAVAQALAQQVRPAPTDLGVISVPVTTGFVREVVAEPRVALRTLPLDIERPAGVRVSPSVVFERRPEVARVTEVQVRRPTIQIPAVAERVAFRDITKTRQVIVSRVAQAQRSSLIQAPSVTPAVKARLDTKVRARVRQSPLQIQAPAVAVATRLSFAQVIAPGVTAVRAVTVRPGVPSVGRFAPLPGPPVRRPRREPIRRPGVEPAFVPQVKVKGKFRDASAVPLPRNKAINLGARVVDRTTSRSFRVVRRGQTEVTDDVGFRLKRKFRKKDSTFIERSRHAIDSSGERAGIPFNPLRIKRLKESLARRKAGQAVRRRSPLIIPGSNSRARGARRVATVGVATRSAPPRARGGLSIFGGSNARRTPPKKTSRRRRMSII